MIGDDKSIEEMFNAGREKVRAAIAEKAAKESKKNAELRASLSRFNARADRLYEHLSGIVVRYSKGPLSVGLETATKSGNHAIVTLKVVGDSRLRVAFSFGSFYEGGVGVTSTVGVLSEFFEKTLTLHDKDRSQTITDAQGFVHGRIFRQDSILEEAPLMIGIMVESLKAELPLGEKLPA